jgi:hypothetical protein
LQEKDDSLLTHTYQSIEEGWEKIAKDLLGLVIQYWDTERTVKVVGTDGFFDVLQLKGTDFKSGADIRMEGGSALPVSKAARQAFIMDMMKMGFIQPEDGLKILDVGGVQKLWQRLRADESAAQRENIKLKRTSEQTALAFQEQQKIQDSMYGMSDPMQMGQPQMGMQQPPVAGPGMGMPDPNMPDPNAPQQLPPDIPPVPGIPPPQQLAQPLIPVNTWDNHGVHIEVHNNFRKGQSFELLPEAIKAEFEAHVNMHLQAASDAMSQVNGLLAGSGGLPGASSGAGPTDAQKNSPTVMPDIGGSSPNAGTPPPSQGA